MDNEFAGVVDGLLPERLRSLQRLSGLPVVFGGSARVAPTGRQLTISRVVGTVGSSLSGLRVCAGRGLGGAVLREAIPQRVNDYATTTAITHDYDDIVVGEEQITSVLAIPVVVRGTVQAVLYGAARDRRPIGDRAMRTAGVIAAQLQRDVERWLPDGGRSRSSSSAALDELAAIIGTTGDQVLRARLLRIHRELSGRPLGLGNPHATRHLRLTARELDALRLAAIGATNVEIASELGLSRETVKAYLRTAMRKLDARNRTAAVHAARLLGFL